MTTPDMPTTAANLVAFLEEQFPGRKGGIRAGADPVTVMTAAMDATIKQFDLAARYPTLAAVKKLLDRTAAARKQLEAEIDKARPTPLTQTQHLNFALFAADAVATAKLNWSGVGDLKTKIDAAKSLVTA